MHFDNKDEANIVTVKIALHDYHNLILVVLITCSKPEFSLKAEFSLASGVFYCWW